MNRSRVRVVLTAVPLVICNLIAFTGQLSFIRDHLHWPLVGDIGFAAGLESIAVFLAFMAHDALMAEDSAFRLRLGAYGAALVAAGLNYSHYSVHMHPTFAAAGTALMSGASPALWGVFSRRASRDALMAKGLIEPHALRLGMTRWLWHPLRATRVMWLATWDGVTDPREAVARWQADAVETHVPDAPAPAPEAHPADAVETRYPDAVGTQPRAAIETHAADAPRTHPLPESETHPRNAAGRASRTHPQNAPRRRGRKPVTDAAAETHFAAYLADGQVPSVRQIERELHVGRSRAQAIRQHLAMQAFST